jgi:hypothetical protein
LTLAGSVPVVFGTTCWARLVVTSSAPEAAAAAAAKKVRRPMVWSLFIGAFLPEIFMVFRYFRGASK